MQLNKQIIIILVLASLLLSSIASAFYFYKKNKSSIQSKNELVTIFIAKEDIKKNTLLTLKHLAQTQIAKQYLLKKPLLKKEIVGKYTKERIFKHEMFIKEKLNTKIEKSRAKVLDYEFSSSNMNFTLFKNPNYSLIQGDLINIISVFPKVESQNERGEYTDYNTQYVAKNIRILGFLRDGFTESQAITKQKVEIKQKKKIIEKIADVKSNELILDIQPQILIRLISDFNKGNQLWMVKTKDSIQVQTIDEMEEQEAKKLQEEVHLVKLDTQDMQRKIKKTYKAKVYKYKWYEPKNNVLVKSAIIDYSNNSKEDKEQNKPKKKSVNIIIDSKKQCLNIKDKFVIGSVNRFFIRDEASIKSKTKRIYEKNTIIPYLEKLDNWYKTCDGLYVSKKVVKEISYEKALQKVGKR